MTNLDVIKSEENENWANRQDTSKRSSPYHSVDSIAPFVPSSNANSALTPDTNIWRLLNYESNRDTDRISLEEASSHSLRAGQSSSPSSSASSLSPPPFLNSLPPHTFSQSFQPPRYPVNPPNTASHWASVNYSASSGVTASESVLPSNCSDIIRSMAAKYNRFEQYSSALRRLSQLGTSSEPVTTSSQSHHRNLQSSNVSQYNNSSSNLLSNVNILRPSPPLRLNTNSHNNQMPTAMNQGIRPPFVPTNSLSSAQILLNMVRNVRTREQISQMNDDTPLSTDTTISSNSFSSSKRPNEITPLDLSSSPPLSKRQRLESEEIDIIGDVKSEPTTPHFNYSTTQDCNQDSVFDYNNCENNISSKDPSTWSIEHVYNFVKGIDICEEYAESFRNQHIDGWCLSLLTECHLTSTLHMKLGPALKLLSKLKQLKGSCSQCSSNNLINVYSNDVELDSS